MMNMKFEEIFNYFQIDEIYKKFIEKILNEEKPNFSNLLINNLFEKILILCVIN